MNNKDEKVVQEFERLERIAKRIITKHNVSWGDFILCMNAIIVNISMEWYAPSTKICKEALQEKLSEVLSQIENYYGTKEED